MHVQGNDAEAIELDFDIATLDVDVMPADAIDDFFRLFQAVDGDTAIALFLGIVVVAVIAPGAEDFVGELVFLGLGFLNAYHVGFLFFEPVKKTLAGGGTNAVGVNGYDSHEISL